MQQQYAQGYTPQLTPQPQAFTPQLASQPLGYAPQMTPLPQRPLNQPRIEYATKFYKSGLFLIASAAGRIQRDVPNMERQGWHLQYAANLGVNLLLRRVIVAVYTRGN